MGWPEVRREIYCIRQNVSEQFELIEKYPSEVHRLIILYALIEAFAQDNSQYEQYKSRQSFVQFLQEYDKKHSTILRAVCPITLYYDCFSADEGVSLLLQKGKIYSADSLEAINESTRLTQLIKSPRGYESKHSYAGLMYAMRSKLTHELSSLNMPINFDEDAIEQVPHMVCESEIANGQLIFRKWSLHIPEQFVIAVAREAILNYLQKCEGKGYIPFKNIHRKCVYSWYD